MRRSVVVGTAVLFLHSRSVLFRPLTRVAPRPNVSFSPHPQNKLASPSLYWMPFVYKYADSVKDERAGITDVNHYGGIFQCMQPSTRAHW